MIEPGGIRTEFISNAQAPENIPDELKPLVFKVADKYRAKPEPGQPILSQSADEVASVIVATAENPSPNFRVQTNPLIQSIFKAQLTDPTGNTGPKLSTNRFFPPQPSS